MTFIICFLVSWQCGLCKCKLLLLASLRGVGWWGTRMSGLDRILHSSGAPSQKGSCKNNPDPHSIRKAHPLPPSFPFCHHSFHSPVNIPVSVTPPKQSHILNTSNDLLQARYEKFLLCPRTCQLMDSKTLSWTIGTPLQWCGSRLTPLAA